MLYSSIKHHALVRAVNIDEQKRQPLTQAIESKWRGTNSDSFGTY
jgi:hypothetical protein